MSGKKKLDDLDKFAYTSLLQEYRDEGRNIIWEQKDGTPIEIKDMGDRHLKNTINMLKRKPFNGTRAAWIEILEEESLHRRILKIDKLKDNIDLNDIFRTKE